MGSSRPYYPKALYIHSKLCETLAWLVSELRNSCALPTSFSQFTVLVYAIVPLLWIFRVYGEDQCRPRLVELWYLHALGRGDAEAERLHRRRPLKKKLAVHGEYQTKEINQYTSAEIGHSWDLLKLSCEGYMPETELT